MWLRLNNGDAIKVDHIISIFWSRHHVGPTQPDRFKVKVLIAPKIHVEDSYHDSVEQAVKRIDEMLGECDLSDNMV